MYIYKKERQIVVTMPTEPLSEHDYTSGTEPLSEGDYTSGTSLVLHVSFKVIETGRECPIRIIYIVCEDNMSFLTNIITNEGYFLYATVIQFVEPVVNSNDTNGHIIQQNGEYYRVRMPSELTRIDFVKMTIEMIRNIDINGLIMCNPHSERSDPLVRLHYVEDDTNTVYSVYRSDKSHEYGFIPYQIFSFNKLTKEVIHTDYFQPEPTIKEVRDFLREQSDI